jgi:hypothetical protein
MYSSQSVKKKKKKKSGIGHKIFKHFGHSLNNSYKASGRGEMPQTFRHRPPYTHAPRVMTMQKVCMALAKETLVGWWPPLWMVLLH